MFSKYRIKCITEDAYVYTWSKVAPTECPNNASHTIDYTSIAIVEFLSSKIQEIVWISKDGFTYGGSTGSLQDPKVDYLRMYCSNVTNRESYIWSKDKFQDVVESGSLVNIEFVIYNLSSIVNQNIWLRFSGSASVPPSETVDHLGWKIIGQRIWASNADGSSQTIFDTGVDIVSGESLTQLNIKFSVGGNIEFYINGNLKVIHETNLPVLDPYLHLHIKTLEDVAKEVYIGRVVVEKI
jgi:hypothetical protein